MADPVIPGFQEAFHIELVASGLDPADRTHPPPDTTPLLWGFQMLVQLNQIRKADTGSMLLRAIRKAGPFVRIIPRFPVVGFDRDCNADTIPIPPAPTPGARAQVEIRFSPHRFLPGGFCDKHDGSAANLPHEKLFHELVHALRMLTKKRSRVPEHGGLLRYDNNEEFYAVLVTNIFISDPSNGFKSGLRQGHTAPHQPLDKELASSFDFFRSGRRTYALIAQFFRDHPSFAHELACSRAVFNPLAAYDRSPARARQMSESGQAQARDTIGAAIETVESQEFQSRFVTPLLRLIGG
jgi:hypothetical protein